MTFRLRRLLALPFRALAFVAVIIAILAVAVSDAAETVVERIAPHEPGGGCR